MDQLSSRLLHFVSERILLSGPDGIGYLSYHRFIQDILTCTCTLGHRRYTRNSYVEQSTMCSRINNGGMKNGKGRDETI